MVLFYLLLNFLLHIFSCLLLFLYTIILSRLIQVYTCSCSSFVFIAVFMVFIILLCPQIFICLLVDIYIVSISSLP